MPSSPEARPGQRRVPRQERARMSHDAILDAMEQLVEGGGAREVPPGRPAAAPPGAPRARPRPARARGPGPRPSARPPLRASRAPVAAQLVTLTVEGAIRLQLLEAPRKLEERGWRREVSDLVVRYLALDES